MIEKTADEAGRVWDDNQAGWSGSNCRLQAMQKQQLGGGGGASRLDRSEVACMKWKLAHTPELFRF